MCRRYKIPAGTGLWTPLMALHNTTANWGADAEVYRPERWLEPGVDYLPPAAGAGSTQQTNSGSADAGHQGGAVAGGSGAANGTDGSKARSYELNVSRTQVWACRALLHMRHCDWPGTFLPGCCPDREGVERLSSTAAAGSVETMYGDLLIASTLRRHCSTSLGRMLLAGGPSASYPFQTAAVTASARRSRR